MKYGNRRQLNLKIKRKKPLTKRKNIVRCCDVSDPKHHDSTRRQRWQRQQQQPLYGLLAGILLVLYYIIHHIQYTRKYIMKVCVNVCVCCEIDVSVNAKRMSGALPGALLIEWQHGLFQCAVYIVYLPAVIWPVVLAARSSSLRHYIAFKCDMLENILLL